jgi:hypothetical protein
MNVVHFNKLHKLYLVFEFLDQDLKNYMDKVGGPLPANIVKVCCCKYPSNIERATPSNC